MRSVRVARKATATSQKKGTKQNALSDFFRQGVLRGNEVFRIPTDRERDFGQSGNE